MPGALRTAPVGRRGVAAGQRVPFMLPHVGGSLFSPVALSYLITGIAFGLVHLITGSMTATMVARSLQSCFAFAQILLFGHGGQAVPGLAYVVVLGCPIWTYLVARGLHALFPKGDRTPAS
ncbi:hypothetical protein HJ590_12190 [Naumannella sp. ID2617S]|nr:hypothetical protein [Naumannella sp. ID2617S]